MMSKKRLLQIIEKRNILQKTLNEPHDANEYAKLARECAEIEPIANMAQLIFDQQTQLDELNTMLKDEKNDADLVDMAIGEVGALEDDIKKNTQSLKLAMLPKDEDEDRNIILEIRAGTGGEEAALFAADLHEMYHRYAQLQGWKIEIISANITGMRGYKEVISSLAGKNVFRKLQFESGVHRVQRIPQTESGGRIHTSAATVAILPEADDIEAEIDPKDLRIDVFRASGAGGQHVNKTESAVRITHIPTTTVVVQQDDKSQHKNKAKAMRLLRARLYEKKRDSEMQKRAQQRQKQIGTGDRSERIRTYNFPQGRVTDHRIGLTLHNLTQVMQGEGLQQLVDGLLEENQAQKLNLLEQ